MVVKLFLLCALLFIPFQAAAEPRISSEITTAGVLDWSDDGGWSFSGIALGKLDIQSPPGGNVQGRLQLSINPELAHNFAVPRAYLRFRLPVTEDVLLRITSGIDRVTWGVGAVLNAGDLIFQADPDSADSLQTFDSVRDETAMLFSVYAPLGELNFLEAVVLPEQGAVPRFGLRLHSAFEQFSLESSYLYDGSVKEHGVSVSLQRDLFGADVYGGFSLKGDFSDSASVKEGLILTGGGIYSWRIGYDQQLSARLETMVTPGREHLLKLYGDIGYVPNRTVRLIARGLVEPDRDWESTLMIGASWNLFQGFDIQSSVLSSFSRKGFSSEVITLGCSYRF